MLPYTRTAVVGTQRTVCEAHPSPSLHNRRAQATGCTSCRTSCRREAGRQANQRHGVPDNGRRAPASRVDGEHRVDAHMRLLASIFTSSIAGTRDARMSFGTHGGFRGGKSVEQSIFVGALVLVLPPERFGYGVRAVHGVWSGIDELDVCWEFL